MGVPLEHPSTRYDLCSLHNRPHQRCCSRFATNCLRNTRLPFFPLFLVTDKPNLLPAKLPFAATRCNGSLAAFSKQILPTECLITSSTRRRPRPDTCLGGGEGEGETEMEERGI